MKIEFVKREKSNGDIFYFTQVDGRYINNSIKVDEKEAKLIFDIIVKNKGIFITEKESTLLTIEI